MGWQFPPYAAAFFANGILSLVLVYFVWQRRDKPGGAPFALLILAVGIWSLGRALEAGAVGLNAKVLWAKVEYLGIASVGTLWLIFCLAYIGQKGVLKRSTLALLGVIPAVTVLMAATNERHFLLWSQITPTPEYGGSLLHYEHGAWFWVAAAYNYAGIILGSLALLRAVLRAPDVYRRQVWVLISGTAVTLLANLIYLLGLSPVRSLDLTPFAFSLSGLIFFFGLFRYKIFDMSPVARDAIIENMSEGVLLLDSQRRVVDINPAAQRLLGLTSDSAVGQDFLSILASRTGTTDADVLSRFLECEQNAHVDISLTQPEARHLSLQCTPWSDERFTFTGILVLMRDHTEQVQVEDEARQLRALNESILQHISEGVVVEDNQSRFAFANPAAGALLGYTPEELIGKPISFIIPPDQQSIVTQANLRRTRGQVDQYEIELLHKDGRRVPVLVSGSPHFDEASGTQVGTLAVFTNLSEIKRTEKELEETRALLQSAFEQSPIPKMLVSAPDMVLRILNPAAEKFLGIEGEDGYVNRSLFDMKQTWKDVDPEGKPIRLDELPLAQALKGVVTKDKELGVIRKDGTRVWEMVSAAPIYNRFQELIAALVVFPDITERKRAQEAEHEQRILLEALRDSAAALNSTLNIDEVLDRILANIGLVVPHDAAHIALVDERGDTRVVRASGYAEKGLQELVLSVHMKLDELPNLRKMAQSNQPVIVSDQEEDSAYIDVPITTRTRSSLSAPVLVRGQITGYINLDSATPGFFTSAHADRLRAFADQAAIAFENAHLFDEIRRRSEQLETLNQIGVTIASGLDMDHVIKTIFEQCQQVVEIDTYYLALLDEQTGLIRFPLFIDRGEENTLEPQDIHTDPGMTGNIIQQGQTVYIADALAADSGTPYPLKRLGKTPARSFIGVPLSLRDKVLGVLSIQSYRPHAFTPDQVHLLETIASQAAVALENALLFETMEQLAITDPLTGLYNRRHFFFLATTEMERAARYNKDLSVIMIDLDHFKLVNDTYGHKTGDQVLQSIAQSANQALRRIDVMGRYGGEEFAILLPETNMEKGMIVAERLRALIDHTAIPTGQGEIKITACFGLAGLETCPPDIDILLDCADKALYAAKQAGRNQVRVFRGGYKPSF